MPYTRALKYRFPLAVGEDVLAVQSRLRQIGLSTGQPDGVFGPQTETAVLAFQRDRRLKQDGIVGSLTWSTLFGSAPSDPLSLDPKCPDPSTDKICAILNEIKALHRYKDGVAWCVGPTGVVIDGGSPETTGGEPATVRKVWQRFGVAIDQWALKFGVPAELIIATICTESRGDPSATREEPGYLSDEQTPSRVSPGLMQTLISTARSALADNTIDRHWLLEPGNSIRAGTAYIASQWKTTHFDPPKVACAYNAGGVYHNTSPDNRWKMKQYPINSDDHADRFIKWFNDCFVMFEKDGKAPAISFFAMIGRDR